MSEVYPVLLFYKYVPIAEPENFAAAQRVLCSSLGLKGRVLIAAEGINGTLAGTREAIGKYVAEFKRDARFADVEMKISNGDANTFPKLAIKVRAEIVTLNGGENLAPDRDNHLSPADWKRMLERDPEIVVVDVRNRFESAVGKFENAIVCDIGHFRELPEYVDRLANLKDKKVLMYCTGGVRCEKASALFRGKGFAKVFQLHGGIVTYQEQFGNEHWLGECFVFDQRMTLRVEKNLVQIGRCAHTDRISNRIVNCLDDDCHTLFILSEEAECSNADYRFCPNCLSAKARYCSQS